MRVHPQEAELQITMQREASILTCGQIADKEVEVVLAEDEEAIAGGNKIEGEVVASEVVAGGGIQIKEGLGGKSDDGLEPVGGGQGLPMVEASDV